MLYLKRSISYYIVRGIKNLVILGDSPDSRLVFNNRVIHLVYSLIFYNTYIFYDIRYSSDY